MNREEIIIEWFEKNKCDINNKIGFFLPINKPYIYKEFDYLDHFILLVAKETTIDTTQLYFIIIKCFRLLLYFFKFKSNSYFYLLRDTLIKNNYSYTFEKSIKKFGWISLAVELEKKKNRLHGLLKIRKNKNYGSIENTLLSLAGYCVLALIYIENNKE